jgi:hypothetical protein
MANQTEKLAGLINGRVAEPGDPEYLRCVQIDNGRINRPPRAVVIAANVDDVVKTIRFAGEERLRLTVRSGGHSATGYCLNEEGLVLDTRMLGQLELDAEQETIRIGMGAIWRDVYNHLQVSRAGLVAVAGGCLSVGAGGFLLGGGYSFVSRSYGLGIDNVLSLTLVTADGSVRKVGPKSKGADADLFWAACGGGGGNFGVAVESELKLHRPNEPNVLAGQILFPFYRIDDILPAYNEWVSTLPDAMAVYGFLGNQPDPKNGGAPALFLRFTPVFNGSFAEGMSLLQPLFKLQSSSVSLYSMTLPQFEAMAGSSTSVSGRGAYIRSALLAPGTMDDKLARVFKRYMSRMPTSESFVVWTHAGGQIASRGPAETAYWHRNSLFMPEVKAIWDVNRPQDARSAIEWGYNFFEEVGERGDGAYLNYIDPLLRDWKRRYYGGNLDRLSDIKKTVDPKNFFHFQQGISSAFQPDGKRPLDLGPLSAT